MEGRPEAEKVAAAARMADLAQARVCLDAVVAHMDDLAQEQA